MSKVEQGSVKASATKKNKVDSDNLDFGGETPIERMDIVLPGQDEIGTGVGHTNQQPLETAQDAQASPQLHANAPTEQNFALNASESNTPDTSASVFNTNANQSRHAQIQDLPSIDGVDTVQLASGAPLAPELNSLNQEGGADTQQGPSSTNQATTGALDAGETNVAPVDIDFSNSEVAENASGGTVIATLSTVDANDTDTHTYEIVSDPSGYFEIVGDEIRVKDGANLDFETAPTHEISIQVTDSAGNTFTETMTINLTDLNEHDVSSIADTDISANTIAEDISNGDSVGITASALDADGSNNTVTYSLSDDAGGIFEIDASTGEVSIADASGIDYETAISHTIEVTATSEDGSTSTQSYTINVTDVDEFDISAVTDTDTSANSVDENAAIGTTVGIVASASDADGTNSDVTYSLSDNAGGLFTIDATTGEVTTTAALDAETASSYDIEVTATSDDGSTSSTTFTVDVNNLMDEGPTDITFTGGTVNETVSDGGTIDSAYDPSGSTVATLSATDADSNDTFTYAITNDPSGQYEIVGNDVRVKADQTIDFETAESHDITIEVTDAGGNTYSETITINVQDFEGSATGASSDDSLTGTSEEDNIFGGAGSDIINSGDGNDYISGGNNGDTIDGGSGDDAIYGDDGRDTIVGGDGDDYIDGGKHGDTIDGGSGDDAIYGGHGHDTIVGGDGDDYIDGGTYADTLTGGAGDDIIVGGGDNGINTDVAIYSGNWSDYTITEDAGTYTIVDNRTDSPDGTDTVSGVGEFEFADGTVAVADLLDVGPSDIDVSSNSIDENSSAGTVVATLSTTDNALDSHSYTITNDPSGFFEISGDQILVKAGADIDFEDATSHDVTIEVTDANGNTYSETMTINLTDLDEFDVTAITDTDTSANSVDENAAIGTTVGIVASATDADGTNSDVTYSLSDNAGGLFTIDATTGEVTTTAALDAETASSYDIEVTATSEDGSTSSTTFTVDVNNLMDEGPTDITFTGGTVNETVSDGGTIDSAYDPSGSTVATLSATDADSDDTFTYAIINDPSGHYEIVGNDVRVKADQTIDFETTESHDITIEVTDAGGNTYSETITINVQDFEGSKTAGGGSEAVTGTSEEDDISGGGGNDTIYGGDGDDTIDGAYGSDTIYGGAGNDVIYEGSIGKHAGILYGEEGNDTLYTGTGTADDQLYGGEGDDTLIDLGSSDSHADYDGSTGNDLLDGGAGNDDLQGGLGQERLIGGEGNDTIDGGDHTDTAVYSGNWSDYTISESSGTHTIVDNRAGSPDGTDTVTNVENFEFADGTVAVADLLDVGPSDIDVSSNSIDENSSAGTVVATLSTTDNALDSHSYTITNDPSGFFEISGDQILVKAGADIDFEDATSHDVTIEVTDANGNTYSEMMTINVTDLDEFDVSTVTDTDTSANSVDENAAIGTTVGIVASASDADGTNSDVTYSLSDNAGGLFTIDATTGEVTTTAALDAETASSYDIEVTATSDDGSTSSTTFTVDVNNLMDEGPTDITFTGGTVNETVSDGGTIDSAYDPSGSTVATLSATDADSNDTFTYAITNDPSGHYEIVGNDVRVKADQTIDFETAESHDITIEVTDAGGNTYSETITINVQDFEGSKTAGGGSEAVTGTSEEDDISGGGGNDTIYGGDGDDTIDGAYGSDTIYGGAGNDVIYEGSIGKHAGILYGEEGNDTLYTGTGTADDQLYGGEGDDTLIDLGSSDSHADYDGSTGNDLLDGGAGNDDLQGGLGQERLIGGEGNDTIDGGDHTDTAVYSGNWSDYTISESSGTHTIVDNRAGSPDGTDTVTNVENFEFADGTVAVADLLDVGPSDIDVSSNSIDENSSAGTVVATLSTTDNALDSHSYTITNDPSGFFEISGDQILVKAGADIDFEDATSHDVTIEVTDANGNTYSETMTINLTDLDEFDVSAVTDTDTPANSVDENAAIGTTVGIVASASDADGTNSDVTYSLSDNAGGLFTIDATTGEVTTTAALDAETASSYDIEVTATSDDGSTSSTTFTVDVNNLMDEGPTDITFTGGTVNETVSDGGTIDSAYDPSGSTVATLSATDADSDDTFTYAIINDPSGHYEIVGNDVRVKADQTIDFETTESHDITIEVTDAGGNTYSETITINVQDFEGSATGASSDDSLTGTSEEDNIFGGAGSDIINSGDGNDYISGGNNGDTIDGGSGDDAIYGDDGRDTIVGGDGDDYIDGGNHGDTIDGGSGDDAIYGGHGHDTIVGGDGDDYIDGGTYADTLTGGAGDDIIVGGGDNGINTDVAIYSGNWSDYTITEDAGTYTIVDNRTDSPDGTDTVSGVGEFEFADGTVAVADLLDVGPSDIDVSSNSIDENSAAGTVVATLSTTDNALDSHSYTITNDPSGFFEISGDQILVKAGADIDFEDATSHDVTIEVTDANGNTYSETMTINLTDLDEFDVSAVTDTDTSANTIAEDISNGDSVGITASALDADGSNNLVTYSLSDDAGGIFEIDASTGEVSIADASGIDYETAISHTIEVTATSEDGSTSTQSYLIDVTDIDEFDISAVTDTDSAANTIAENASAGDEVGIVASATDADATNSNVTYAIDDARFDVASDGTVTVASGASFDAETEGSIDINVTATSADGSTSIETFSINVSDIDEFDVGAVSDSNAATNGVDEDASVGDTVGITALASDGDITDGVTYSLSDDAGGLFDIDANTGVVTVAGSLDAETDTSHTIEVTATSDDGSTSTQTFAIGVNDVNETSITTISDTDGTGNSVTEGASVGTAVGLTALATDADATDTLSYSLSSNPGGFFAIDANTGDVTVAGSLDYETDTSHTIEVTATSTDGTTSMQTFTINVTDEDEHDVSAVTDTDTPANSVDENAAIGTTVGIVASATDADGTNSDVAYSLSDNAGGLFTIDATTGEVTTTAALDAETASSYDIEVTATSDDGSTSSTTFTVDVNNLMDEGPTDIEMAENHSVTIDNAGFEDQAFGNGGHSGYGTGSDSISGWVHEGVQNGAWNPTTDGIPNSGDNVAYIDGEGIISQELNETFDAGESYSASVFVRAESTNNSWEVRLYAGDQLIGSIGDDEISVGTTMTEVKLELSADQLAQHSDYFGENITIELYSDGSGSNVHFDDVSLDVIAENLVSENASEGTVVTQVQGVTDADAEDVHTFALLDDSDGAFAIDANTGVVTVADPAKLDFEDATSHNVTIEVTDAGGNTYSETMTINVTDLDEHDVTAITDTDTSANTIAEDISNGDSVGITASALDADGSNNLVTYSLSDDAGGIFEIDASTGEVSIADASGIDYETAISHTIEVTATSEDGSTSTQSYLIDVTDVDEFDVSTVTDTDTSANSVDENAAIGTTVGIVASASDADGTNSDVAYSLSDNAGGLFTIDATTGEVTTTAALDAETASSYDIEVTATSDDGSTSSTTFTVDVNNLMDEGPTDISFTNHTEDFEGGATGWSNNTTTDGGNSFSEFLGRFGNEGGLQATEKTFSTPEDANKTVIELDVYEIDSWDGESIIIEVAGETISIPLSHNVANESEQGSSGSVSWSLTSDDTNSKIGFSGWADQQHHLTIEIANPGENVTFNISSSLNQSINDESFGIDNFSITSFDADGEEILTIDENSVVGTVVATLSTSDADASDSHSYAIINDPSGFFEISGNDIVVKAGADIDFEDKTSHDITVEVTDAGGNTYSETIAINVSDIDDNDVGAVSDSNAATNGVDEDASVGDTVGITALASDGDITDGVTYSLSDDAGGLFDIDANTGVVTVAGSLDAETDTSHTIEVTATSDDGSTSTQTFAIGVNDVNETSITTISDTDVTGNSVTEGASVGTAVGLTALATDADASDTISYSLSSNPGDFFAIDANSGEVTVAGSLDYETDTSHTIEVTATSSDGTTSMQTFTIAVGDEDEHDVSSISDTDTSANTIAEGVSNGDSVGITASATDADGSDNAVTYSLSDDAGGIFDIDTNSGEVSIADASSIDYETATSHSIEVTATSADGSTSTQSYTIDVTDVPDEGPTDITFTGGTVNETVSDGGTIDSAYDPSGSTVATLSATDADSDDTFTYAITNDPSGHYEIVGNDVRVKADQTIDFETAESHDIAIEVTDAGGNTYSETITINVQDFEGSKTAGGGSEAVTGTSEEDDISGGVGNDTIYGGDGDDTIDGGTGNDTIYGGAGDDVIYEGSYGDREGVIYGEEGNDTLYTGTGTADDQLYGGEGDDTLIDLGSSDSRSGQDGSTGNDLLDGGAGNDDLQGGLGQERLIGGEGNDTIDGGDHTDTAVYSGNWSDYTISESSGTHTIVDNRAGSPDGTDTVTNVENFEFADGTVAVADLLDVGPSDIDVSSNSIDENSSAGTVVATLSTTDNALDSHTYEIINDPSGFFEISGDQILVKAGADIDFEDATSHDVTIEVTDSADNTYSETVTIDVTDVSDQTPTDLTFDANEDLDIDAASKTIAAGSVIGKVDSISDVDTNDIFKFELTDDASGKFDIDANTGEIKLAAEHDATTVYSDTVDVQVTDAGGNTYAETVGIQLGTDGSETLTGTANSDIMHGFDGQDTLNGGDGNDILVAGDGTAAPAEDLTLNDTATDGVATVSNLFSADLDEISYEVNLTVDNIPSSGANIVSYATMDGSSAHDNEFTIMLQSDNSLDVIINQTSKVNTGPLETDLTDGSEHRLSVTWDNTDGDVKVYVDGAEEFATTGIAKNNMIDAGGTLTLGQEQDSIFGSYGTNQIFSGTMDDVRIFNDVRTATEIADNHDTQLADPSSTSNLVANWQFDGESGTNVTDLANHYDLTLSGDASLEEGAVVGDTLNGGDGDDILISANGSDTIDGGAGTDTVSYEGSDSAVNVNLTTDILTGGDADGDTLASIENVTGSDYDDTLTGDAVANTLVGGDGNDTLDGLSGKDTLDGGVGDDIITAGFDDGTGDIFIGGEGNDTYQIEGSTVENYAFNVDLNTGTDQYHNSYSGIENINGGSGDDTFIGDDNVNIFNGGAGDDTMYGGGESDIFVFGEGDGADTVYGGDGDDWTDTIELSDAGGDLGTYGADWTSSIDSGSIDAQDANSLTLSDDTDGAITLADGSTVDFFEIERIEF